MEGHCLELSFDGESCTYEGPTELTAGPVELIFLNKSEAPAAVNFLMLLEGKTVQDVIEYNGEEPTSKHAPSWTRELGTWRSVAAGESHHWEGDLEPASYFMVCARISPLGVWLGTGLDVSQATAQVGTITTVAGTGEPSYSGDGGPATEAQLEAPSSLAFDSAGNLYIGEFSTVRKVDPDGLITTVAGTGVRGFSGDGLPATEADIDRPQVGVDAEGILWVLNRDPPSLRKIDSDGIITTIAGMGNEGAPPEDGSRVSDADLCGVPFGPDFDAEGNIYISCEFAHLVFKIESEGTISRVAGTGEPGFSGDGGLATEAQLFSPFGMAFDSDGNLYIADLLNARIRKVDTNGIITTVAGTGTPGYSGDGGPATEAELSSPFAVAVDPEGNVYFSSHTNKVVRKIDTEGIITTVAGGGEPGVLGDGGPATEAGFRGASLGIAIDAEGNLYIADDGAHRVRKVTLGEADGS
ncbi:MAG: hypothetical protein E3J21_04445 [Anaerolineales bacterium]|nr:MAG: hypothetical protein E3J21_04445 [Anaerolineales bacterium]